MILNKRLNVYLNIYLLILYNGLGKYSLGFKTKYYEQV